MSIKRINITEVDKTTPSGTGVSTDVVYIPGLAKTGDVNKPIKLESEADLVKYFGDGPVAFTVEGSGEYADYGIDYDVDLSYIYAKELLRQGIAVVYERVTDTNTVEAIYTAFEADDDVIGLNKLTDVGEYEIKFITSGAYPVYNGDDFTLVNKLVSIAATRGDAVAVVDHTSDIDADFYDTIKSTEIEDGEYGVMFTTFGSYDLPYSGKQTMPASFGYLMAFAKSVKTNANYLAVAGTARGQVPYLTSITPNITNSVADSYQSKDNGVTAINAITTIKPYGLTIWGNRTLLQNDNGLKAGSYLNLRSLICDVKKSLREVALSLIFEQNSDVLWLKFKSRISPVLDKMVAGNGILAYNLIKNTTEDRSKFSVDVVLQPIYPVEEVEIKVVVTDDDVTVA